MTTAGSHSKNQRATVGFIGLGMMGKGLATQVLRAAYPTRLLIRNTRTRERCAGLIDPGVNDFTSPQAVAEGADVIVICVTGSPEVEAVVFAEDGLLKGLKAGAIVVDCSTSLPESSRHIAEAVRNAGGHFIDAALTGTPKDADEGAVNLLVGGELSILDAVRPVLNTFAKNIYHCGGIGAGHTIKLLHQFVVLGNAAILAEAFSAAKKSEVDLGTLCDVIGSGGANSTAFQRFKPFVLDGNDELFKFSLSNALKDMDYYTKTAADAKSVATIAGTVLASYTVANNQGAGAEFIPKLLETIDILNGMSAPTA